MPRTGVTTVAVKKRKANPIAFRGKCKRAHTLEKRTSALRQALNGYKKGRLIVDVDYRLSSFGVLDKDKRLCYAVRFEGMPEGQYIDLSGKMSNLLPSECDGAPEGAAALFEELKNGYRKVNGEWQAMPPYRMYIPADGKGEFITKQDDGELYVQEFVRRLGFRCEEIQDEGSSSSDPVDDQESTQAVEQVD